MSDDLSRIGAAVEHLLITIAHGITSRILDPFGEFTRPGKPTITFFGVSDMGKVTGTITGTPRIEGAVSYEYTIVGPVGEIQVVTSAESMGTALVEIDGPGDGTIVERQINTTGVKSKPTSPATFLVPDPFAFATPDGSPTVTFPNPDEPPVE